MTIGVGIDLVEVSRLSSALERHGARFEERVFTRGEIDACAGRADRILALAARFAAKEACLKALGTGWARGIGFREIEVVRDANGRPGLRLHGAAAERARSIGAARFHVSLTHQPTVAAAVVVLDGSAAP